MILGAAHQVPVAAVVRAQEKIKSWRNKYKIQKNNNPLSPRYQFLLDEAAASHLNQAQEENASTLKAVMARSQVKAIE